MQHGLSALLLRSWSGLQPDAGTIEAMLDDFVRTEGSPEVVQFSGGEPTIHPQIIDFVKAAKDRGIPFVMINTNGKRIAHDDRFLEQLNEARPSIYFQFDGFDTETYRIIRGEPGILEEKLRALDRLASMGLSVTLVPAIERGVNEHEIGKIIELAIQHPAVRGINFQPAFHRPSYATRSFAAHHDPGCLEADRAANSRQVSGQRLHSRPLLFPNMQFSDLRFHRRRASHSAIKNCQRLRLSAMTLPRERVPLPISSSIHASGF